MAQSVGLLSVFDQSVGVYGTAPTCYLSTLARVPGFSIDDFDAAIADRQLVRMRAMRHSVHTLPVDMVPAAAAATRGVVARLSPDPRIPVGKYETIASAIEEALSDGPMPLSEIRQSIDPEHELGDHLGTSLARAADEFRLVRTTTLGSWRSDRFAYARWSDWLPGVDPGSLDEVTARRKLVDWYVQAYGPVELEDVKWWAGWTKTETLEAVDGIDLTRAGNAAELLGGTRLLPVWDVMMVAYRNRDRLVDASHTPLVYDRYENPTSVVLRDGRVVGQWDLGSNDSPLRIKVAPFSEWSDSIWDDVESESRRIADLVGAESLSLVRIEEPTDLLDSSRNRFLAPLSRR